VEIGYDEWDKSTGELVDAGIQRIPCGRKGCPVCGPRLKRRYIAHFASRFCAYSETAPVFFATLTVDPKVGVSGRDDSRKYLMHCWDKWGKRMRRRASSSFHYVASIEEHKSGRYHLHVIISGNFEGGQTARTMREQWFESGGGAVAKVKRVRAGSEDLGADKKPTGVAGAVGYVLKYAFKHVNARSGRRSVVCSQGDGYHSEQAQAERRAFSDAKRTGKKKSTRERTWDPPSSGGHSRRGSRDTITREDRARFEALDKSRRTSTYKERQDDGTWKVYTYADGDMRWERYSTWPDADGARVIATSKDEQ
jgi:hypothetical protein